MSEVLGPSNKAIVSAEIISPRLSLSLKGIEILKLCFTSRYGY
jgi:hypothetical protein